MVTLNLALIRTSIVNRLLFLLGYTADYSIWYQGGDLCLVGYTDADWGCDLDKQKSTSGYAFLLSQGAISGSSKKHMCIALSTREAKFVAYSAVVQEVV